MRRLAATAGLLLLCGCEGSLDLLRKLDPQAGDFDSALAREYLAFADAESEQGRPESSEYFAAKGVWAQRDQPPPPDQPADSLDPVRKKELAAAREELLLLSTDDIRHVAPQQLARAQLIYDCWQYQLAVLKQASPACAEEFAPALEELQPAAAALVYRDEFTDMVPFAASAATLGPSAMGEIRESARQALALAGKYRIILRTEDGMTQKLTQKRLMEIKKQLVRLGIAPEHIRMLVEPTAEAVHISGDEPEDNLDVNQVSIIVRSFIQPGEQP